LRHPLINALTLFSKKTPGILDELAAEREKLLEKESAKLEAEADRLAGEIKELNGEAPSRIS
jgi:hypothetical protein